MWTVNGLALGQASIWSSPKPIKWDRRENSTKWRSPFCQFWPNRRHNLVSVTHKVIKPFTFIMNGSERLPKIPPDFLHSGHRSVYDKSDHNLGQTINACQFYGETGSTQTWCQLALKRHSYSKASCLDKLSIWGSQEPPLKTSGLFEVFSNVYLAMYHSSITPIHLSKLFLNTVKLTSYWRISTAFSYGGYGHIPFSWYWWVSFLWL